MGILKALCRRWIDHSVPDKAAQLSFYFFFALFPLLFFAVTITAYLPIGGALEELMDRASYVMPDSAVEMIRSQLDALVHRSRPKLLTLAFLVAFWGASRGVDAIRVALNLAYEAKETRPYWKTQALALLMTLAGTVLILLAVTAIVVSGKAGLWLALELGWKQMYLKTWSWLRWPITIGAVMLALALSYFLLPNVRREFKFITPGSVLGTMFWLLATWGFSQYVKRFAHYNVAYGAIGGVIALLMWLYIGGIILILGGEINALVVLKTETGPPRSLR